MRVVLLRYSWHLPALESVLEELQASRLIKSSLRRRAQRTDAVDCIERLHRYPHHCITHGECDREVMATRHGDENKKLPPFALEILRWSARQLAPEHEQWIAGWPRLCTTDPGVGRVLFCHATPRDDNEIFTARTDEDRLLPIFDAAKADVVVCGHTHMQFDRIVARRVS